MCIKKWNKKQIMDHLYAIFFRRSPQIFYRKNSTIIYIQTSMLNWRETFAIYYFVRVWGMRSVGNELKPRVKRISCLVNQTLIGRVRLNSTVGLDIRFCRLGKRKKKTKKNTRTPLNQVKNYIPASILRKSS